MSHSNQIRQLIDLVESFDAHGDRKQLLAKVTDIMNLTVKSLMGWRDIILQGYRLAHPDPEEFSRLRRLYEIELSKYIRSLRLSLRQISVKLDELENAPLTMSPKRRQRLAQFLNTDTFNLFFKGMRDSAQDIESAIELLEEEGYFAPDSLPHNEWSYRDEVEKIYDRLLKMRDLCDQVSREVVLLGHVYESQ